MWKEKLEPNTSLQAFSYQIKYSNTSHCYLQPTANLALSYFFGVNFDEHLFSITFRNHSSLIKTKISENIL